VNSGRKNGLSVGDNCGARPAQSVTSRLRPTCDYARWIGKITRLRPNARVATDKVNQLPATGNWKEWKPRPYKIQRRSMFNRYHGRGEAPVGSTPRQPIDTHGRQNPLSGSVTWWRISGSYVERASRARHRARMSAENGSVCTGTARHGYAIHRACPYLRESRKISLCTSVALPAWLRHRSVGRAGPRRGYDNCAWKWSSKRYDTRSVTVQWETTLMYSRLSRLGLTTNRLMMWTGPRHLRVIRILVVRFIHVQPVIDRYHGRGVSPGRVNTPPSGSVTWWWLSRC